MPTGSYDELNQSQGITVNDGNRVKFIYRYFGDENIVADKALGTIGEDGTLTPLFVVNPNDSILFCENSEFNDNNCVVEVDSDAFQPGDSLTLYPMVRFRQPDAQWQLVPPLSSHVVTGRTAEGEFFCYATPLYQMQLIGDPVITRGTGKFKQGTEVTFTICNTSEQDYTDLIYFRSIYYGHFSEDEITEDTPYFKDNWIMGGANISAGDTATVAFLFTPQQSGVTLFQVETYYYNISNSVLILPFDTLNNYNDYIDNNSYFTRDGDQWFYNIELCDKPGVRVPYWVPSDSVGFEANFFIDSVKVNKIFLRDEIKEYLKHLPENAGNGEYKFKCRMPIDISQPGTYRLQSGMGTWIDGERVNICCTHIYQFQIDTPSGITTTTIVTEDGTYYDLTGQPLDKGKLSRGIYIVDGKKVFVW